MGELSDREKIASFGEAMEMLKEAEFHEDHKNDHKHSNKKEIAEDVMLGGLGAKAGGAMGAGIGLAKGKQHPLANPVGMDEVKTRQARKLVNSALHNHQAKLSGIKGGLAGAGIGLGLAGAGIAMNHLHNREQEKTAGELPRPLTLHGVTDALFHHRKTAGEQVNDHNDKISRETQSHQVLTEAPEIAGMLELAERTANPATRRESISELFSNNQLHRYDNILPRPLLFGKDTVESEILKPKKNLSLDVADQGGPYHPFMQTQGKHWSETGRGVHTKKS